AVCRGKAGGRPAVTWQPVGTTGCFHPAAECFRKPLFPSRCRPVPSVPCSGRWNISGCSQCPRGCVLHFLDHRRKVVAQSKLDICLVPFLLDVLCWHRTINAETKLNLL